MKPAKALRSIICLIGLGWAQIWAGESGLGQQAAPLAEVQLTGCSVKTACLCPWHGLLSLDDFSPIDLTQVPGHVLSYRDQQLCEWHVVLTTKGPKVFHEREDYRRDSDSLKLSSSAEKRPWDNEGKSLVVAVSDGYIVARDAGEWGADLWWLRKDGRESALLGKQHVTDLLATPKGVVATVDSSETGPPSERAGQILLIARTPDGRWQVSRLTETVKPALTAALRANGDVLIATGNQLLRLDTSGSMRLLHAGRWSEPLKYPPPVEAIGSFSPNSILPLANGDILIGMSAAIVRLTPGPVGYSETWYVPRSASEQLLGQ